MISDTKDTDRVGILTSGGDAPGMNAALRAAVRTALDSGTEAVAISEGLLGLVEGGDRFRQLDWDAVGGIMHKGGTVIGTARCEEFRARDGRLRAAQNLVEHGIDRLIVIGGDGSLTAADLLHREWPGLIAELEEGGRISPGAAKRFSHLRLTGIGASIDNDMSGTDMSIGADTALHRIAEAVDAISATAASHQRTFVVEVMGRHSGYLALMSGLATGADAVFIPEAPPSGDSWKEILPKRLRAGRQAGRRDSIVLVAEGAIDSNGQPITAVGIKQVLEESLEEEVRVTILGHVQRGGAPSAYDRLMGTLLGHAAALEVLAADAQLTPQLVGVRHSRITRRPLGECVEASQAVTSAITSNDSNEALRLRGDRFSENIDTLQTLLRSLPNPPSAGQRRLRLAVLSSGGPAPGMNTATRAAVRLALDEGHQMLGVRGGFQGLMDGHVEEFGWMSVRGWTTAGGCELGVNRVIPRGKDFYSIARRIEDLSIDGILMIGGWSGYDSALRMTRKRESFPAFEIPIICLPATINNNLPGSELSIGSDTALNAIVEAVDKIKQSAVASRRCFVVEVMGRYCGYLALMAGLASGAERVYLNEEGVSIADLQEDVEALISGFSGGKRLGLMIRNEMANPCYDTQFMVSLFEEEGQDLFDVRQAILGHLQQGGDPSPFDRILATRLAKRCVERLIDEAEAGTDAALAIGLNDGKIEFTELETLRRQVDSEHQRPKSQWWMDLRPIAKILAQPGPSGDATTDD
ncbi:MAG: 6-phosphofructokinase [Acidobacteria bacterium]|jgi:6-phosphofructokinase 1|nr:6-phosphofructokinase [Acidobacteriota bacterium]